MAMAAQRLFPGTKVATGPWTEHGFFYDMDFSGARDAKGKGPKAAASGDAGAAAAGPVSSSSSSAPFSLSDKDLKRLEKEMRRLIRLDLPFWEEEVTAEEAARRVAEAGEPYKREILEGILRKDPNAKLTLWHIGGEPGKDGGAEGGVGGGAVEGGAVESGAGVASGSSSASSSSSSSAPSWWDLCAGPHVSSTGSIPADAFSLDRVAGAYWRGDESRPQLTRVSGQTWRSRAELESSKALREEAARRDHRTLGRQLDLFSIAPEATGPGLVLWHPNGSAVRNAIESYWKDVHSKSGYQFLNTPHVARRALWCTSGHAGFYADSMFAPLEVEGDAYQLKPMNCPGHVTVYAARPRSYKELPLRWAELGTVYRYERSGTLQGLFRVRGFTQDDAHIFCRRDQVAEEVERALRLTKQVLSAFGFADVEVALSTRPDESVGEDDAWEAAENALRAALDALEEPYTINPKDGAFYGPKVDVRIRDALGRPWQCSTVQLDFNLPERFDLTYKAPDGSLQRPTMIHRALLGSLERFFGILIEHHAGAFPLWLAPTQVELAPISDDLLPQLSEIKDALVQAGVRVNVSHGERTAKLIRDAELRKVPLIAVLGKREAERGTIAIRRRGGGTQEELPVDDFVQRVKDCINARTEF